MTHFKLFLFKFTTSGLFSNSYHLMTFSSPTVIFESRPTFIRGINFCAFPGGKKNLKGTQMLLFYCFEWLWLNSLGFCELQGNFPESFMCVAIFWRKKHAFKLQQNFKLCSMQTYFFLSSCWLTKSGRMLFKNLLVFNSYKL